MKLYITGDIDIAAYVKFDKQISKLAANGYEGNVDVVLMSPGGDAQVALAFFDRIRLSPLNIQICGTGIVASAAVLILAAGKRRYLTKNTWVMVHEESMAELSGDVSTIEKEATHLRRLETQWNELLASVTPTRAHLWANLHEEETYLTATECLDLGLVEEIV